MAEKCWECNGTYKEKMIDFSIYGVSLGKFKAKVCDKCGDKIFSEGVSDKIDAIAKQKGLFGLESKTAIGKVGNSFDIKISKKITEFCGLKKGAPVTVHPATKSRLIIDIVS